ncbi:MAG: ATP-binding protein [bacterium]|nr:ATP-binding protein [bacterium]
MINKIRKRFIVYTMIVVSLILSMVMFLFFLGTKSPINYDRTILLVVIIIALVFAGSLLLSKIAIKPIGESWKRQLDFTADASHELRTPLAVIQSNLEIVLENEDETVKDQEKWLENIRVETERMGKLVEDLLTLSRADTKEQTLALQDIPLAIIVNGRVEALEALARKKHIQIHTKIDDTLLMKGDVARISQLFTILIENAINYMGRPGEIRIMAKKNGKHIEISVSDNGEGIPKDEVEKVFLRFYRVDKARTRNQGGSGLGLPIAKWIVEAHGGKITLNSVYGSGTEVKIFFFSN